MSQSIAAGNALTSELLAVIDSEVDVASETTIAIVRAIVRYLDFEYGGQRIYKKSAKRELPALEIERALAARVSQREICRKHNISAGALRRLLKS